MQGLLARRCVTSLLVAVAIAHLTGCGESKGSAAADGAGNDFGLTPTEQTWAGNFRSLDPADADTKPLDATLMVNNETKAFLFKLPKVEGASAEGTWENFQGKSWMFHITKSTISKFGAEGDFVELNYELMGRTLSLKNNRIELRLLQPTGVAGPPSSPGGPTDPNAPSSGRWYCADTKRNNWSIDIKDESFFASITKAGTKALWVKGGITATGEEGKDLNVRIVESNNEDVIGSELLLDSIQKNQLRVRSITRSATGAVSVKETFTCRR